MNAIRIQRKLEISSNDEHDLEQRVAALRHVVADRHGTILDVTWATRTAKASASVSIRYSLPLGAPALELGLPAREGSQ